MMTKEKFKDLMYKMQEINEFEDKLYDMKIDIINCKLVEYPAVFFDELMRSEFGEDGLDLISWWLYEDVDHKIYDGYERIDSEVIADLNNIDDLYKYLTEGGRDRITEE